MKVYVIYKFSDIKFVEEKLKEIKGNFSDVHFFYFNPKNPNRLWHRKAKEKIKDCNQVIFFDTVSNDRKENVDNIKWELKIAEKYKKRIIVFKTHMDEYYSELYEKDYSEIDINKVRYKTYDVNYIIEYFKKESEWNIQNNLLNNENYYSAEYNNLLFEQYKLMVDTSEKLMERRHATGNLYTTICSALITFLGASFAFNNLLITSVISLLAGVIIIILCINWRMSLNAYELNNQGKFAVINQIEKHLPADMFECEYRYNTLNGIRSYSSREKKLPIIFMCFGVALIMLSIALIIVSFVL